MRGEVTAEQVVDVAAALLDEGGFDALSVRRVADRLGVSRQVVYTHFGGMRGLLDALHVRASSSLSELVAGLDEPLGTSDHLVAAARAYVAMGRERPHHYQLLFEQPVADYTPSAAAHAAGLASFGHVVESADAWLHGTSVVEPDDPSSWRGDSTELARVLWTAGHGFVVLERGGYASVGETDRLVARTVRAVLAGWRDAAADA